jgi:hypothetical protein
VPALSDRSHPQTAWREFDRLVAEAGTASPWTTDASGMRAFVPDHELLERLLAVPIRLGSMTRSGIPAKAVDIWVAHELRRAGFLADEVWPRATPPRVLPHEIALMRSPESNLTTTLSRQLFERLESGKVKGGIVANDAYVLGKAYAKQVDVLIAQWSRGPELMVSTKRMDSSFGKNALNRIEESYGDAKNLRGRYPLAATGFLFVMRSTALAQEPETVTRLMDLLVKLAEEPDAYDVTGLIITEWIDPTGTRIDQAAEGTPVDEVTVRLRQDAVPKQLRVDRFLATLIDRVLTRTPVNIHVGVRERRDDTHLPVDEAVTGALEPDESSHD